MKFQQDETTIDLSFRPDSYWPESPDREVLLSRIQGKARRDIARRKLEEEGVASLGAFLGREELDDFEREAWGAIHPQFMGGVPQRYSELLGAEGFLDCLLRLSESGGLGIIVEKPEDWRPETPFFRVPPGKGSRKAFERAAGGSNVLIRDIERRTQAKPVFIMSGIPGSAGSGLLALWTEIVTVLRDPKRDFGIWPSEGSLEDLRHDHGIVLGESYPRASYAVALTESLPTGMRAISKTNENERVAVVEELRASAWIRGTGTTLKDLAFARDSEDDFDALMTAAALVRFISEKRPLSSEMARPTVEGGILGTGGIDFSLWSHSNSKTSMPKTIPRTCTREIPLTCPIPGCGKVFVNGRGGWDAHVGSIARHPDWHPDVEDHEERKTLFKQEHRDWFRDD